MKKTFLILSIFSLVSVTAQRKKIDILRTSNIKDIENFLQTAHPDDPRRTVLKPKLIALKNATWMKSGKNVSTTFKQVIVEIPKSILKQRNTEESEEFKKLLAENSKNQKDKTVKLLNQLFNEDVSNREAILLLQNNSDCNMILRIEGEKFYNLAVPSHGENSVVIAKGSYQLRSNVCDAKYVSAKTIQKSTLVILDNPEVHYTSNNYSNTRLMGISN